MQSNEEEFEIMYFSAQSPRDGSTIFERRIHLTKPQRKELDFKLEEHSVEFKRIFDTLCPQFDVRLSVIGDWLKGKKKPIPEKKEFLNWFISEKIGSYSFDFKDYTDTQSGQFVEETTISITDFKQCFIPSLIDDYLLEFCKQYADKLERKELQLSAPTATKTNEKVKEIKDISKANDKDRRIGNRFEELMITHKDKKTVLAIIGRQTDLEVSTKESTEKDKTDSIRRTLRKYGIIK